MRKRVAVLLTMSVFICSVAFANGIWSRDGNWRVNVERMSTGTCAYEVSLEWLGITPVMIGSDRTEYSFFSGGTPQKIKITDFQNIIKEGLNSYKIEISKSKRTNIPLIAIDKDRPCGIGGYIQTVDNIISFSVVWDMDSNSKLFIGQNVLHEFE